MTADGPPAPEPPSAPEAAAGLQPSRIVPALWMPVAPTLTWLAFGSAETDVDTAHYFGASIWHAAEPDRIVEWLADIEDAGAFPRDDWPKEFALLEQRVTNRAAQTASFQAAMAEAKQKRAEEKARAEALGNPKPTPSTPWPKLTEAHLKKAATQLLERLEACLSDAASKHAALWAASETLRRAIANGEVRAYGWRGHGPDFSDQHKPLPLRERIPADLCAAPVTITQHGLLSFARGDGSFGNYHVLWSELLFDSVEILKIKPEPADGRTSVPYEEVPHELQRDLGGIDARHEWQAFNDECLRRWQERCTTMNVQRAIRDLRKQMQVWTRDNMTKPPHTDTVRHRVTKLVKEWDRI